MKFAVTAAACGLVGWDFARVGTPDAVLMENVRWLAGYRHPRVHHQQVADRLVEVFGEGSSLLAGARRVGDQIAVPPVLFHLLLATSRRRQPCPRRPPQGSLTMAPVSARLSR